MGNKKDKIDKKAKTNNIDGLRRKYEALLLEDKKRKERNEYILDKFDKMRKCTFLAHTNSKPYIQDLLSFIRPASNNSLIQAKVSDVDAQFYRTLHHRAPDTFAHTSTALVLKDIYNHYILIPKRWPSRRENSAQVDMPNLTNTTDANSDWKSKYDILNKLKQEEKEDLGNETTELSQSELKDHLQFFGEYPNQISQKDEDAKLPDKNISSDTITLEDKNDDSDIFTEIKDIDRYKPTSNPISDLEKRDSIDDIRAADNISTSEKNINNKTDKSPSDQAEINPKSTEINHEQAEINPDPLSKIEGSEKIEYLDDDGINPAHISYPSDNLGKPFGEVPDNIEDMQYPIDVINIEDFTPRDDVAVHDGVNVNPEGYEFNQSHFELPSHKEFTSPEDVIVKDGVIINSEEFNMNESNLDPVLTRESEPNTPAQIPNTEAGESKTESHNSEMVLEPITQVTANTLQNVQFSEHVEDLGNTAIDNEFETEQGEALYQAPTSEISYDQIAVGDAWEPTQNENYMQNEPYYYEGTHEQEAVQINEHEETSTLYDQNYEQQYMNTYEQQEYPEVLQPFDQPQVGYDQPLYEQQGYDQTEPAIYNEETPIEQFNLEYDQEQYRQENYEAVQQVEETLSQEEGYVVMQNEGNQEPKVTLQQQPQL